MDKQYFKGTSNFLMCSMLHDIQDGNTGNAAFFFLGMVRDQDNNSVHKPEDLVDLLQLCIDHCSEERFASGSKNVDCYKANYVLTGVEVAGDTVTQTMTIEGAV